MENPVTRSELKTEIEAVESRVLERIEKVGTTLLREFRKWAISFESRFKPTRFLWVGSMSGLFRSKNGLPNSSNIEALVLIADSLLNGVPSVFSHA